MGILVKFPMKPLQVLQLLLLRAKQAPGSTPLTLLPCHPDYLLSSHDPQMPLVLMLKISVENLKGGVANLPPWP